MKKYIFLVLTLVFALVLTSCAGVNTTQIIKMGDSIATVPEYRYYLRTVGMSAASSAAQATGQSLSSKEEWENVEIEGVSAKQFAKDQALKQLKQVMAFEAMGKKEGYVMPDAEKTIKTQREASIKSLGGIYEYKSVLNVIGIDEQTFNSLIERAVYAESYQTHYMDKNQDALAVSEEEAVQGFNKDYITVKHILIKSTDDNGNSIYEDAQKKALEIKAAIDAGQDFDKLQNEHSGDGRDENGNIANNTYTFTKDSGFVQEFKDASFALKIGEVSGLVESTYGFHIIKRVDNPTSGEDYDNYIAEEKGLLEENAINDLIEKWTQELGYTVNQKILDGIKVTV